LPDVLEHVDDSQECGDRHDLRPVEFDALPSGSSLASAAARRDLLNASTVVERDRSFDGLDGVLLWMNGPLSARLNRAERLKVAVPATAIVIRERSGSSAERVDRADLAPY